MNQLPQPKRYLPWHIGDVLAKLRVVQGLTRKELADRAGIKQNTLGDLERNVSNYEQGTLAKVTAALNVTIESVYELLPNVQIPPETDPVDAETITRFLGLDASQKRAVRVMVDVLGQHPDRQRPPSEEDADATHQTSRHGT